MQRRNLGGADHENPLAVLHDFKRIAFKIAGQIETDSLVVAPHEVDQRADLDGFDAEIRIAAAGMQNVQGLNRSDQLRPEVLVDAERVFDHIDHRVFVLEFQHEAHHAAVQIEIRKQHVHVGPAGHGGADIQRDGRGSNSGLRRKERENLRGRFHRWRFALDERLNGREGLDDSIKLERIDQKLTDADPHGFTQQLSLNLMMDRDDLDSLGFGLQEFHDLLSFVQYFEAKKDSFGGMRAKRTDQVNGVGGRLEPRRQLRVRANNNAAQHFLLLILYISLRILSGPDNAISY